MAAHNLELCPCRCLDKWLQDPLYLDYNLPRRWEAVRHRTSNNLYKMGDRASQRTQISQRVEGVRVVLHIQEQGALVP